MAGALPKIETLQEAVVWPSNNAEILSARRRMPTFDQSLAHGLPIALLALGFTLAPKQTFEAVSLLVHVAFLIATSVKILLILISPDKPTAEFQIDIDLPRYTVMAALRGEADVIDQLVGRLACIDYPTDRLEGFLLLEADDPDTIMAARTCIMPQWLSIVVVPPGMPRTKPRALNHGLGMATGTLLTVYDAEDDPHPQQLKEAASRFAANGALTLGCLQAPLRIRLVDNSRSPFLDRQFAAEYATLFQVTLPGLCGLGLPYPLGGTSNHFRMQALRDVGGWDAWNVTEDADLGFRLWRRGWRQDVIQSPTHEPPPGRLEHWLPQRTRWLKGYMQTWGVHTRSPQELGWRGMAALVLTIGVPIMSASMHAISLAWVIVVVAIGIASGSAPMIPALAAAVLTFGVVTAWMSSLIGCRRAGTPYSLWDMVRAPLYWSLLTLAFNHALWRLIWRPFVWDKTVHAPDVASLQTQAVPLKCGAGRQVA